MGSDDDGDVIVALYKYNDIIMDLDFNLSIFTIICMIIVFFKSAVSTSLFYDDHTCEIQSHEESIMIISVATRSVGQLKSD